MNRLVDEGKLWSGFSSKLMKASLNLERQTFLLGQLDEIKACNMFVTKISAQICKKSEKGLGIKGFWTLRWRTALATSGWRGWCWLRCRITNQPVKSPFQITQSVFESFCPLLLPVEALRNSKPFDFIVLNPAKTNHSFGEIFKIFHSPFVIVNLRFQRLDYEQQMNLGQASKEKAGVGC